MSASESVAPVSVRRAPRLYRFMAVGLVLGVLITLVLTFSFPEQEDFTRLQVLGFTGIFVVAIFVAIGALVALAIDRGSRRRARTVSAERVEEHHTADAAPAASAATSAQAAAVAPAEPVEFVQITDDPDSPRR